MFCTEAVALFFFAKMHCNWAALSLAGVTEAKIRSIVLVHWFTRRNFCITHWQIVEYILDVPLWGLICVQTQIKCQCVYCMYVSYTGVFERWGSNDKCVADQCPHLDVIPETEFAGNSITLFDLSNSNHIFACITWRTRSTIGWIGLSILLFFRCTSFFFSCYVNAITMRSWEISAGCDLIKLSIHVPSNFIVRSDR